MDLISQSIGDTLLATGGVFLRLQGGIRLKRYGGIVLAAVIVVSVILSRNIWGWGKEQKANVVPVTKVTQVSTEEAKEVIKLEFPSDKYPETARHIKEAIAAGIPNVCTIDRGGVFKNREISLETVPVKKGYKRGQWPLATCAESKVGADVSYISPKDDDGANSWIDQHLEDCPDGTRVEFIVK